MTLKFHQSLQLVLSLIYFTELSSSVAFAQAGEACDNGALISNVCYDYCPSGLEDDPDHDGWGYASDRSCVVRNSSIDPLVNCLPRDPESQPVDIGYAFARYEKKLLECQYTYDVGTSIKQVTEYPLLEGSCGRHYARLDPTTQKLKNEFLNDRRAISDLLKCGKLIFFYGGYEVSDLSIGMPEALVDVVLESMEPRVGKKLSKLGFFEDPWDDKFPLGISPSPRVQPNPDELQGRDLVLSCAACHVGQTKTGNFHVGMANENIDIGALNKYLYFALYRADQNKDSGRWPEKVRKQYDEINLEVGLDPELVCDPLLEDNLEKYYACIEEKEPFDKRPKMVKALDIIYLNGNSEEFLKEQGITLPSTNELLSFDSNTPGVYNPVYPSMTITDRQVLWSAGPIWRLKYYQDEHADKHRLGSILQFKTLEDFVQAANFATFSDPSAFSPKFSDPIASYVRSFVAPKIAKSENNAVYEEGVKIFRENCFTCHDGVDGETTDRYPIDEMGAPTTYIDLFLNYQSINEKVQARFDELDSRFQMDRPMRDIASRKLRGIGERSLFFVNGSVKSLEEAFCLSGPRVGSMDRNDAMSKASHMDLCNDYSELEKTALIEFLNHW